VGENEHTRHLFKNAAAEIFLLKQPTKTRLAQVEESTNALLGPLSYPEVVP